MTIKAGSKPNIMSKYLYMIMGVNLLTGSCNTLILKAQNMFVVDPQTGLKWSHPYFQTAYIFIGELLFLFVYYLGKRYGRN